MEAEPIDAEALYRAHAPFVAGFLVRLGARRADMDDLLQEVFLVAHRRGGYAPGPARPTTWLAEIAFRVLANARRARARRAAREPLALDESSVPSHGATPEQSIESARAIERVQRCLETLDDDHRVVLVLHELYGEGCAEIAAALGIPVGTVHSRLHHARRKFHAAWARATAERRVG